MINNRLPDRNVYQKLPHKNKNVLLLYQVCAVLITLGAFAACTLVFILFRPLQPYGATVSLLILTSPLWISLGLFMERKLDYQLYNARVLLRRFMLFPSFAGCFLALIYTANAKMDNAPETILNAPIAWKDYSIRTGGERTYFAMVVPESFSNAEQSNPLANWIVDRGLRIHLSKEDYLLVQPGLSIGKVTVKPGFLGIPWVVRSKVETGHTMDVTTQNSEM